GSFAAGAAAHHHPAKSIAVSAVVVVAVRIIGRGFIHIPRIYTAPPAPSQRNAPAGCGDEECSAKSPCLLSPVSCLLVSVSCYSLPPPHRSSPGWQASAKARI